MNWLSSFTDPLTLLKIIFKVYLWEKSEIKELMEMRVWGSELHLVGGWWRRWKETSESDTSKIVIISHWLFWKPAQGFVSRGVFLVTEVKAMSKEVMELGSCPKSFLLPKALQIRELLQVYWPCICLFSFHLLLL